MDAMWLRTIPVLLVFFALSGAAYWSGQPGGAPWYSVLPPLIAVSLALITHRVVWSLAIAVFIGGLLAHIPQAPGAIASWGNGLIAGVQYLWNSATDTTNLQILAFVVFVMAAISVLIVAGGLQGIVNWLMRFARGPRSSQVVTAAMGLLLFIDDYANTMIVGNSLRPMTDKNRVSREKLAFLVDATSAPVAGVAVISTWIGYEVGLFGKTAETLGIPKDGYALFFDALSFRFYCILMIVFVLVNAISGYDFGPMARAQRRALKTGALSDPDAKPMTSRTFSAATPLPEARIRVSSALIPLGGLFVFLLAGLWWDGGGMARLSESAWSVFRFTAWRDVMGASENSILLLAIAAVVGLLLASACAILLARLSAAKVLHSAWLGVRSSVLPIIILLLAWSLKGTCDGLKTGEFLSATIGGSLSPVWFPALLFMVAGLTAFSTGTSWGTMAILIPTAIPVAFQLDGGTYGLVTMISLGAVLDGAIFGDHCSPISDTTIMSSISSSCDHIHHVRTQIPYSLTVAGLSIVFGYLPAALGAPSWIGLSAATILIVMLFLFLGRKGELYGRADSGAVASRPR